MGGNIRPSEAVSSARRFPRRFLCFQTASIHQWLYLLLDWDSNGAESGSSGMVYTDSATLPDRVFRKATILSVSSLDNSLPNCAMPMILTALSNSQTLPLWKYG